MAPLLDLRGQDWFARDWFARDWLRSATGHLGHASALWGEPTAHTVEGLL
ncbi:hypothetical protein [Kordiimonas aestuarii]|nr:hypothetical protein [Kordiimonas aestuarii]